jgi:hypothetical protein
MAKIERGDLVLQLGQTQHVFSKWGWSAEEPEQAGDDIMGKMSGEQLAAVVKQNAQKIGEMQDVHNRLVLHTYVLKLCLAQGLATYHQQVSAVLKGPVELGNVAPKLLSIDRTNLGNSIRLALNLEPEQKQASRILKEFPSRQGALLVSPPGTGDRKRAEPMAQTENKGNETPGQKPAIDLLKTIDEQDS